MAYQDLNLSYDLFMRKSSTRRSWNYQKSDVAFIFCWFVLVIIPIPESSSLRLSSICFTLCLSDRTRLHHPLSVIVALLDDIERKSRLQKLPDFSWVEHGEFCVF